MFVKYRYYNLVMWFSFRSYIIAILVKYILSWHEHLLILFPRSENANKFEQLSVNNHLFWTKTPENTFIFQTGLLRKTIYWMLIGSKGIARHYLDLEYRTAHTWHLRILNCYTSHRWALCSICSRKCKLWFTRYTIYNITLAKFDILRQPGFKVRAISRLQGVRLKPTFNPLIPVRVFFT